ncbi:MAG TPA: GMC family oxidoreductase [Kofleriaceae bacterium]|nr:GMC family oxidoreductase [Kofleriaceae bacterium]
MRGEPEWDALIVGAGVSGGWAAMILTEAGLRVLVLDAGPDITPDRVWWRSDPRTAERPPGAGQDVQSRHGAVNAANRHLFVDDAKHPYHSGPDRRFTWIRGRQIGGRSLTWGAVTLRMSDHELLAARDDGHGESWPFGHDELARYYDRAEAFMRVHGAADGLPQLPGGSYAAPFPLTDGEHALRAALERRWPERRLIPGRGIPERPAGWDLPYPAYSTQATTLRAALRTGRLAIRSQTIAARIEIDPASARVLGVVCVDATTGRRELVPAGRALVLAASTVETTRLLFNSACPAFPDGLGNRSGALGKHLMDHPLVAIRGHAPGLSRDSLPPFVGPQGFLIPRFRNLGRRDTDYLRGFLIAGAVQRDVRGAPPDECPFMLAAIGEMLPDPSNRIVPRPDLVDAWGIPSVAIECAYGDNERRMMDDALACMREIAEAAGLEPRGDVMRLEPGAFVHEVGTARMGARPESSVLNPRLQCWDVPDLFVVDGACFPSSGCQNPSLTMMALAARASEFVLAHVKAGRRA